MKTLPYIDIYRPFLGAGIQFDYKSAPAPSSRSDKDWKKAAQGNHRFDAFDRSPLFISLSADYKADTDIVIIPPGELGAYLRAQKTLDTLPHGKAHSLTAQLMPLWNAARDEIDRRVDKRQSPSFTLTTPQIHVQESQQDTIIKGSFMIYDGDNELFLFVRQTQDLRDPRQNALGCFAAEELNPWKEVDVKNAKIASFAAHQRLKAFIGGRLPLACLEV